MSYKNTNFQNHAGQIFRFMIMAEGCSFLTSCQKDLEFSTSCRKHLECSNGFLNRLKKAYTPETSVSSKTFMTLFHNLLEHKPISYKL